MEEEYDELTESEKNELKMLITEIVTIQDEIDIYSKKIRDLKLKKNKIKNRIKELMTKKGISYITHRASNSVIAHIQKQKICGLNKITTKNLFRRFFETVDKPVFLLMNVEEQTDILHSFLYDNKNRDTKNIDELVQKKI